MNDCQALLIEHIATMFFGSLKTAYGRVAKLVKAGLIQERYIPATTAGPSASKRYFTSTDRGALLLASHFGYTVDDFNYAGKATNNPLTLKPILDVATIKASIFRACQDHPEIELLEWRNESVFRSKPIQVFTPITDKRGDNKPLFPDGFCRIQTPHGVGHFFIESDSGLEGYKQVVDQMAIYQAYIESGLHQEHFDSSSIRILLVTNGQKRIEGLKTRIQKISGSSRFWFGVLGEVADPQKVLSQPIWDVLNSEQKSPLVEGLTEGL